MIRNLYSSNTPAKFWLCRPDPQEDQWTTAIQEAVSSLELPFEQADLESIPSLVLGEAQFGSECWRLSTAKRLYYEIKPLLPRRVIEIIKKINCRVCRDSFPLDWPIEARYVHFQWEVIRQLLLIMDQSSLTFRALWPDGFRFAFVLTHDVETWEGQELVRDIAAIEEELGFRSSFNFVPERYTPDENLKKHLRERGFEVGVHGLNHDGKLFKSREKFMERARRINHYLKEFDAVGFRSPLTHRNPEWMQALEVEYDLSFFDTDPYEPLPGGVMSIWPFILGRFVELPYTLVQDCTLSKVLGETTPELWLEKVDFIERFHGMALLNTHPDYVKEQDMLEIYIEFLQAMKKKEGYWHALPREVARWWRMRSESTTDCAVKATDLGKIVLDNGQIELY